MPFDDSLRGRRWRTAGSPGPLSHPYPGVSNCRADKAFDGDPQFPIVGLPDCENGVGRAPEPRQPVRAARAARPAQRPDRPGHLAPTTSSRAGSRCPRTTRRPSYTGLAEDVSVHLQAFRLGDILFTVCSCEQWKDQSHDIKTRTDTVQGNEYIGYDWAARCTDDGDTAGTWTCPDPRNPSTNLPPIPSHNFLRMKAQVNNDAAGWNDLVEPAVGRVGADRPDADQGQLHARRAAVRSSATG